MIAMQADINHSKERHQSSTFNSLIAHTKSRCLLKSPKITQTSGQKETQELEAEEINPGFIKEFTMKYN